MESKKRVLLVTSAAPAQAPFSTTEKRPPLGIGYLISVLRNAGHEVFFIDNYLCPSDFLETDYLMRNRIEYVGIYANTICYRDTLRMMYRLEHLRHTGKWKGRIIVGGPHTTVAPGTIPEFVDFVVQGEGERAVLDIVEERVRERIVSYPSLKNLDELPMPAWDYFIHLPYNWTVDWCSEAPVFTMNTSRGCPFRCSFCSVGSIWGKQYTYFSAERIVSEIEYLIREYNAKAVYFREDNFTLNKGRLRQFCNLLIEKNLGIPWFCETRVSTLDDETVHLMSRAGARGFYLGVESGSQKVLDFLQKDITVEQTRKAFRLCREYGIRTAASIIVGVPTETEDDILATKLLIEEIRPDVSWFNVFVGIPDSRLYRYSIENKLCEFIDDRGLVYLKGHNERVTRFYGNGWDAGIPVNIGRPAVSVVMSVRNGALYLEKAVESVLRQTFQDFEFIIVNDASTDETNAILQKFEDPRIRIFENTENLGLTRSLIRGVAEARGEYIARMDADDVSIPHRLKTQVTFLKTHPEYGMVGSHFYEIDSEGKTTALRTPTSSDHLIRQALEAENQFAHGSVMFRRDCCSQAGGYDARFVRSQDYDLWLRIAEVAKVENIAEPLYCWRSTATCISAVNAGEQRDYAELARREAADRKARAHENEKHILRYRRIQELVAGQKEDEALDSLEELIKEKPDFALAYNDLGVLCYRQGKKDKAFEHYQRAVSLEGKNVNFLKNLADFCYVEMRSMEEALRLYLAVLELEPRDLEALIAMGQMCMDLNRPEDAKMFFQKALDLQPDNEDLIRQVDVLKTHAETVPRKEDKDVLPGLPFLSVVITTYNRPELLKKCLEAFSRQTLGREYFEVIVVDDGSSPTCSDVVNGFCDDLHIKYIYQTNEGLAAARNSGIAVAQGEIIVPYDDDNVPHPDCLLHHYRFHREHRDIPDAMLAYMEWLPDLAVTPLMHHVTEVDSRLWCYKGMTDGGLLPFGSLWGGCSSYKKELIVAAGGFDRRFTFGYEDTEAELRMRRHGLRVFFNRQAVNYVSKPVDYEEFCARSYRQGKSLLYFQQLYPDNETVKQYVGIGDLSGAVSLYERNRQEIESSVKTMLEKGWDLPERVSDTSSESLDNLHSLLSVSFDYWKNKGICDASRENTERGRRIDQEPSGRTGKNILVVDPYLPWFDRASGSLRLFTIVRLMRELGHGVTYIARDGRGQERYAEALEQIGVAVYSTDPRKLAQIGLEVDAPELDLEGILKSAHFDIAYLSFYDIAEQYLGDIRTISPGTFVVIDTVDIQFIREQRQAELAASPQALARAHATRERELSIYAKADAVITVTEQDWEHVRELLPETRHFVIPNIHEIPDRSATSTGRAGLLFVGNFNHQPNIDAVMYFVKDILPLIRKALPDVTLTVVGNNPPKEIVEFSATDIVVTGYVPSTASYLTNARVSIAPLRYGAGMKGKIGEAMAYGLPVVTTSIGAEGMGLVHGESVLIADMPEDFAQQVIRLCTDEALWGSLSENGRRFIREHFSLEKVGRLLQDMLSDLSGIQPQILKEETSRRFTGGGSSARTGLTSIIILTWNQVRFTKECVESIRKHTPEPHEIIFVDNGSTDGTAKWLKKLVRENPDYRLIENEKNLGFSAGCNQGIGAAKGEYILLLNNDVVVTEHWLSGMMECLKSEPDIGIVGPTTNNISGVQKVDAGYRTMKQMHEYARRFRERNRHRRISLRRIVGFCMLFRQALVETIGLFDECFGSGNLEDDDFCLRAELSGFRNIIAGDVFIHHYGNRSFIGNRIDYVDSISGNRKKFIDKWSGIDLNSHPGKRFAALNTIEKAQEFCNRGQPDKAAAALLEGIKHIPDEQNIYFMLAGMLIENKQFNDALEVLDQMPIHTSEAKKILLAGYCREGADFYDMALECADRVISMHYCPASAINLQGLVVFKQGDREAAEALFQKALEADPGYGEPYTNLGVMKWAEGRYEEALDLLERGFILLPTVMDIVTSYHAAVTAREEFARAEAVFREAKAFYPLNRRIIFLLIDLLLKQEKFEYAMEEIEKAMVLFGIDDGILAAALHVRSKVGPLEISKSRKKKNTVSLCMIVKNEEENLPRCIASAKGIIDELIVVDTDSGDRTRDIATAFGAKTYDFPWTGDFSEARNFSLSKAGGDWIFVLDADEVISFEDHRTLLHLIAKKGRPTAYSFVTRNYLFTSHMIGWTANDGRYCDEEAGTGWFPSSKVRLFPRDSRVRFENPVHEMLELSLVKSGILISSCDIPVHHYGKLDSEKGRAKAEEYYRLGIKKIAEKGDDVNALLELAIQAGELQKYDEAIDLWQRVIRLNPGMARAYLNLAALYAEIDEFEEALSSARKAVELAPDMKESVYNYALCELYTGNGIRTVELLQQLLQTEPDYPLAQNLQLVAFCCCGKKEQALAVLHGLQKGGFNFSQSAKRFAKKFISAGQVRYAVLLLDMAIETGNTDEDIFSLRQECDQRAATAGS